MFGWIVWLLMVAVAAPPPSEASASVQSEAQQVTAFSGVRNHRGQPRSLADLKGQPTVVWFFPFAGTPG